MATSLVENFAIVEANIWKGGHRILFGDTGTPPAVPANLEDIINPTTFALETGWTDFVATTDDGFTMTREWEVDEGIATDQRGYNLRAGGISGTTMGGSATSLYSDYETLKMTWVLGSTTAIAAGSGITAQHVTKIGAPAIVPERQCVILQMNDSTGKIRAFYFRRAKFTDPGEIGLKASEPTSQEFALTFEPDASQTDGSDFGLLFEQD